MSSWSSWASTPTSSSAPYASYSALSSSAPDVPPRAPACLLVGVTRSLVLSLVLAAVRFLVLRLVFPPLPGQERLEQERAVFVSEPRAHGRAPLPRGRRHRQRLQVRAGRDRPVI